MKQFIIKVFIFTNLFLIPLSLFLCFFPMVYHYSEYSLWLNKLTLIRSKFDYKCIVIGDSRSMAAIDPKILGPSFYNLALPGSSPLEGFFLFRKLLARGNRPEFLIVSYSPVILEVDDTLFERAVKYGLYNFSDINEIFLKLNKNRQIFWKWEKGYEYLNPFSYSRYLFRAYLIRFNFPWYYKNELRNALLHPRLSTNLTVYHSVMERRGSYDFGLAECSDGLNFETERDCFEAKKVLAYGLDGILKLAKKHGIKVHYQIAPYNESSFKKIKKCYFNQYNAFFQRMKRKHPEAHFSAKIFAYPNKFFGDPSHLNPRGRKRFSTELKHFLLQTKEYAGFVSPVRNDNP